MMTLLFRAFVREFLYAPAYERPAIIERYLAAVAKAEAQKPEEDRWASVVKN